MISFEPLRSFLAENGVHMNYLHHNGIISTTTAVAINNDTDTVTLRTINKICEHFNIPIERVVAVIDESGEVYEDKEEIEDEIAQNQPPRRRKFKVADLKAIRKATNLLQQDVAEYIGVHKQLVGLWERGGQAIYEEHFVKLKELLQIPEENVEEIK